mgnify:CR=1 FL=1
MTWERFGYICRKASVECKNEESVSACLSRIENEDSCKLYGGRLSDNSWPGKILNDIGALKNKNSALTALNFYKNVSFFDQLEEPVRLKRVVAYLGYVIAVFFAVVSVYQLRVMPRFVSAFEEFGYAIPDRLAWYQDHWGFLVLIISILLISSLVIGEHLKKLFKFNVGTENSFVLRYLALPSVRGSYRNIVDLLSFPIAQTVHENGRTESQIFNHLQVVENTSMCVSTEISELLKVETRTLLEGCEKQMRYLSITTAVVIVAAIFFFLASAYSPLFVLGESI